MSYDPITYWSERQEPNSADVPSFVENYITTHLQGDHILDYGTGTGRMLYLYQGAHLVFGMDIVDTYKKRAIAEAEKYDFQYVHTIEDIRGFGGMMFDCAVVSKVFLHVLPQNLDYIIQSLQRVSDKIIVWDAICQDAPHVFSHDYNDMQNAIIKGNELLFTL